MTLLSVGTVIRKTDLQSVHGGESKYEPILFILELFESSICAS